MFLRFLVFPVSVGTQGSLLAFGPLGGVRGGRSGCPKRPAVYLLVFYGVFCIYASKTRVFLLPRLQNPRILRCFLHTEASKPSYFTVFPIWYASKARMFLLPRLQNPRILRVFCMVCFKTRVFIVANAENARKWVPFCACELKMLQNCFRETKNELFESLNFRP